MRFLDFLASLKLTMVCLVAAMVLVFAGTIAPVRPGGHLLCGILMVNLVAAHLRQFCCLRLHLIHGGIILLLAGGFFSDLFSTENQIHIAQGETWNPLTLVEFIHERHPGTDISKSFTSRVILDDPTRGVRRDVLISMNRPLRYGGATYYQTGYSDIGTILQVVRNPAAPVPYIACVFIGLGLFLQFSRRT